MKYLLFSFLSLSAFAYQIEYKISYPHGLYKFAHTVAGSPRESQTLYDLANDKKFFETFTPSDIADLKEVLFYLTKSHELGYEASRNFSLDDFYIIKSIQARDLEDLKERTLGILPLPLEEKLYLLLAKMEPFYKKEIWNDSLTDLLSKKKKYDELSQKIGLYDFFETLKLIYQSAWPASQKFYIGLAPIPAKDGHSTASSVGIVESVHVLTNETDDSGRFGVIIHEMAHSLYKEQTNETRQRWTNWIINNSPNKKVEHLFLQNYNEVFATIIGNGHVFEMLEGKLDPTSWYNDEIINTLAKLLYEDFKEYLINKKPLDENFFKHALSKIQKEAPKLLDLNDLYLKEIALVSNLEKKKTIQVRDQFRNLFHSKSIYGHDNLDADYLKKLSGYIEENHSPVLVLKNKNDFLKIEHKLNKKNKKSLKNFISSKDKTLVLKNGNVAFFFFHAKDLEEFNTELELLKKQKYIK